MFEFLLLVTLVVGIFMMVCVAIAFVLAIYIQPKPRVLYQHSGPHPMDDGMCGHTLGISELGRMDSQFFIIGDDYGWCRGCESKWYGVQHRVEQHWIDEKQLWPPHWFRGHWETI